MATQLTPPIVLKSTITPPAPVKSVLQVGRKGDKGDKGEPGTPGGVGYTHSQTIPLATWTVAHNLGRYPSIMVTDHLGNVVHGDVRYVDENIVQVTHGSPITGFVYLN